MSNEQQRERDDLKPESSVRVLRRSEPERVEALVPLVGEQFAKYLLVGEIARGGMGEIFLGVQQGLEGFSKVVVVKRVVSHLTNNVDFIRMFIDEARLAARLEHPNIVKTYEFGDHEGQYYTVMEFLAGEDLRKVLNKRNQTPQKRLALPFVVHIVAQICNGLHFAHELTDPAGGPLDLVHRDVNPANVIVTYTGEVKIIDFGVAKVSTTAKKTLTGVIKGKIAYMAPEHILARPVDRRSDIYSTGVILWELLLGRPLFARDCDVATMYAVMNDPITRPSDERPELPPQLDTIVARALARTPGDRFETADDMRAALDELAATLPKVDARALGRMMEDLFGSARAQAKRSITQSRSLAHNVALVMKATPSLPTVVLATAALPTVRLRPASPADTRRRRRLATGSAMVGALGVLAIIAVGARTPAPPTDRVPAIAVLAAAALPSAALPSAALAPAALPPAVLPLRAVTDAPAQGTLTIETRPNAVVALDGKPIEYGSFSRRPTANGSHELVIRIPGRAPVKRLISIVPAHETRLKIEAASRTAIAGPGPLTSNRAASAAPRPTSAPAPAPAPAADQGSGSSAEHESAPRRLALNPDPQQAITQTTPEIAKAGAPIAPVLKHPSLDVAATRAAAESQIGPLQQCYERAKMDDANLRGNLTARITVTVEGAIASVQISSSTLSSPQVEACITRGIMRWHLPRPSGGVAASFSYPFVFE